MLFIKSKLKNLNLKNKKVFLRADLNVDLDDLDNSFRLKKLLPTLNFILEQGACVILATHVGRPKGYEPSLSTEKIAYWFKKNRYDAVHLAELDKNLIDNLYKPKSIIVLENLRFYEGEKNLEIDFAKLLKSFAEIYVTEGFGVLHRSETSVALLPKLYDAEHKTIGFLVENELQNLIKLITLPGKLTVILGGAKIKDKIILIKKLAEKIDTLILLPAMVFTFLKAMGKNTGKSLVETDFFPEALEIISLFRKNGKEIIIPRDFFVVNDNKSEFLNIDNFTKDTIGLSVNSAWLKNVESIIKNSDKTLYNGAMGLKEFPESLQSLKKLFEMMSESNGYTVVAGGDSVQLLHDFELDDQIDFCSTGGGAALAYISGITLPGLEPFID